MHNLYHTKVLNYSEENIKKQLKFKEEVIHSLSYNQIADNGQIEKEPQIKYFFIIGFEINAKNPSILAMFPSKQSELINSLNSDTIASYCYPYRCERIDDTIKTANNILTGFVFNIFLDDQLFYGIVIHIKIPMTNHFFGKEFDCRYPFSLCVLSKFANISSHFSFLYQISELIFSNKAPSISNLINIPDELKNQKGECIPNLVIDNQCELIAKSPKMQTLQFLLPKLLKYYTTNFYPTLKETYYLLYPSLQTLFTFFPPDMIVEIYTFILLEMKIIFYSRDLNRLSFCVLAATNLVKTLSIEAKIYPVFPTFDNFKDAFDTPFISVFGYPDIVTNKSPLYSKFDVIIDIDNHSFVKKPKCPTLPNSQFLISNIEKKLNESEQKIRILPKLSFEKILENQRKSPLLFNPKGKINDNIYPDCFRYFAETKYAFSSEIIQYILNLFDTIPFIEYDSENKPVPIIDKVMLCMVTDSTNPDCPVSVFNREIFINLYNHDRDFMEQFIHTQIFYQYINKIEGKCQKDKSLKALRSQQINSDANKIESLISNTQNIARTKSNVIQTPTPPPNHS